MAPAAYPWDAWGSPTQEVALRTHALDAARERDRHHLHTVAASKRAHREAVGAVAAHEASCQLRVAPHPADMYGAAQLASGFLLLLPCGPCLVTAAHVLGTLAEGGGPLRQRARRVRGVAASKPASRHGDDAIARALRSEDGRSSSRPGPLARGVVSFVGDPSRFWRHDPVLDVVVVAVRNADCAQRLREVALPVQQLASVASLCGANSGSAVQLTHRQGTTVAILKPAPDSSALATRNGAPLLLDYSAPLVAGTSGAAVYDSRWRLMGVHVRGDEVEARGRGVSIDAVRELIERGNAAPLSSRVRLVSAPQRGSAVSAAPEQEPACAAVLAPAAEEPSPSMEVNAPGYFASSEWPLAAAAAGPPPVQPSPSDTATEQEDELAVPEPLGGRSRGDAMQGYGVMTARVIDAVALAPPVRSSGPQALRDHRRPDTAPTAAPTKLSVSAALTRPEKKCTVLSAWVSPHAEVLRGAANHAANKLAQSERDLLTRRRQ